MKIVFIFLFLTFYITTMHLLFSFLKTFGFVWLAIAKQKGKRKIFTSGSQIWKWMGNKF